MSEKPIIFSSEMVGAILDGRKTQTRRIVKYDNLGRWPRIDFDKARNIFFSIEITKGNPDNPKDVRTYYKCPYGKVGDRLLVNELVKAPINEGKQNLWALKTRAMLEITDIRVERLQDIDQLEMIQEGIEPEFADGTLKKHAEVEYEFRNLWNSIHGPDAWDKNPFVWVISFKRIES